MKTLITICARGGSKGIPGKNIKPIAGKPLIAYSIDCARCVAEALGDANILLSTDSEAIRECAARWGLETPYRRPACLADDHCAKLDAIADALEAHKDEIFAANAEDVAAARSAGLASAFIDRLTNDVHNTTEN